MLDICTLGDAADVNPVIKFLRHPLQRVSQELNFTKDWTASFWNIPYVVVLLRQWTMSNGDERGAYMKQFL
jgi:hypothetical protein